MSYGYGAFTEQVVRWEVAKGAWQPDLHPSKLTRKREAQFRSPACLVATVPHWLGTARRVCLTAQCKGVASSSGGDAGDAQASGVCSSEGGEVLQTAQDVQKAAQERAAEALRSFRNDVNRQQPLPLQVGCKYVPALKQYTGHHLSLLVSGLASDLAAAAAVDDVRAAVDDAHAIAVDHMIGDNSKATITGRTDTGSGGSTGSTGGGGGSTGGGNNSSTCVGTGRSAGIGGDRGCFPAVRWEDERRRGLRGLALLCPEEREELQQLLDVVAGEVRLRLANQHSGRDVFFAAEVVALAGSYAQLARMPTSPSVATMLDSVAGFVVKRVAARHLNAVSRPEDVCRLLSSYAALRHDSVAVPELVAAMGLQLRRQVASSYERTASATAAQPLIVPRGSAGKGARILFLAPGQASEVSTADVEVAGEGASRHSSAAPAAAAAAAAGAAGAQRSHMHGGQSGRAADADAEAGDVVTSCSSSCCMDATLVVDALECHVALRQVPEEGTLRALVTQCWAHVPRASLDTCLRLLQLLAGFRHHPGDWVLELLAARLLLPTSAAAAAADGSGGNATPTNAMATLPLPQLAHAASCFTHLGFAPPRPLAAAALQQAAAAAATAIAYEQRPEQGTTAAWGSPMAAVVGSSAPEHDPGSAANALAIVAHASASWGTLDKAGLEQVLLVLAGSDSSGDGGGGVLGRGGVEGIAAGSALWQAVSAGLGVGGARAAAGNAAAAAGGLESFEASGRDGNDASEAGGVGFSQGGGRDAPHASLLQFAGLLDVARGCHEAQVRSAVGRPPPLWVQDVVSHLAQAGLQYRMSASHAGAPLLLISTAPPKLAAPAPDVHAPPSPHGGGQEGKQQQQQQQQQEDCGQGSAGAAGGASAVAAAAEVALAPLGPECWTCSQPHLLSGWAALDLRLTQQQLRLMDRQQVDAGDTPVMIKLVELAYYSWATLRGPAEKSAYLVQLVETGSSSASRSSSSRVG